MKRSLRYTTLSITSLVLSLLISNTGLAEDIDILIYVEGGISLQMNGDWDTGINFGSQTVDFITGSTKIWTQNNQEDYISYIDDKNGQGSSIGISMTDFIYSGPDPSQADIPAANLKLIGKYESGQAAAADKGEEDAELFLSNLDDSCPPSGADPKYRLSPDLEDSGTDYSLYGNNQSQEIFHSTLRCFHYGHMRFDRLELSMPVGAVVGTYTSTLTFTIADVVK
jgi:hypothetical protein